VTRIFINSNGLVGSILSLLENLERMGKCEKEALYQFQRII
jgi:hypothetical protein